jgi:hypothetical protein
MTIKESLDTFVERYFDNVAKMEAYNDLLAKILEHVRAHHPDLYESFEKELNEMLDGIYYDMVEAVILSLHRKDNIHGIKWSLEDARNVIAKHNLHEKIEDLNDLEFWFVLNKEYATHGIMGRPTDLIIDLAVEEICDSHGKMVHAIKEMYECLKGEKE